MAIVLRSFPQGFGAEVSGFDVRQGCAVADVHALRAALASHALLLFRNCGRLAPERHAQIISWFGTVGAGTLPAEQPATTMDNTNRQGRERLPFHSDLTFLRYPLEGISLHPLQLPAVDTSTSFISNAVAWDTLAPELQRLLENRRARHYYPDDGGKGLLAQTFEAWHPVRMTHRSTGRALLFVTEHHTDRIEGLNDTDSTQLLRRLFEHLYAPARQYEHVWRMGDMMIWDNYSIQHARTREADPAHGPRILQRVWFGEHGYADQLEQLARDRAHARS